MAYLRVNGDERGAPNLDRNLLSFLRFDLGLTGAKYGCDDGLCGTCTVLVDGEPLEPCLSTVGAVVGREITTIESLASDGQLHPVQQAFIEEAAVQCGYCIPGFILAATALLEREVNPSRETILSELSGHICRCGSYERIERSVLRAADAMKGADR